MSYTSLNMGLSQQNLTHLLSGNTCKVPYTELQGQTNLKLTGSQIKRVKAAHSKQKGLTLKFSKRQIAANIGHKVGGAPAATNPNGIYNHSDINPGMQGEGWLSWLTEPVGDALKDVVKPIGEIAKENPELTKIVLDAGIKSLSGRGMKKGKGTGFGSLLGFGAQKKLNPGSAGLYL
jgi:hypothetical protein